jgi:hypothetical protein
LKGNQEVKLIAPDKSPAAESAAPISISPTRSAESAAIAATASDKAAPPEINLRHFFRILSAQIIQQYVEAFVIALNRCARPMQLEEAR